VIKPNAYFYQPVSTTKYILFILRVELIRWTIP